MAYAAAGFTPTEAIEAVARALGTDNAGGVPSDATTLDITEQMVTAAGQAAATWNGKGWWWSIKQNAFWPNTAAITAAARASNVTSYTAATHGLLVGQDVYASLTDYTRIGRITTVADVNTFTLNDPGSNDTDTVAGTVYAISYPLRTVNTNAMTDLWAVKAVWIDDDYRLTPVSHDYYDTWLRVNTSVSEPAQYCIFGEAPHIGFLPFPDSETRLITVSYIQRHSKIVVATSAAADMIVPPEYQWDVYVQGALWLYRHDTTDPGSLHDCRAFMSAMDRMRASSPSSYDGQNQEDMFPDAGGSLPSDRRVYGPHIMNQPGL